MILCCGEALIDMLPRETAAGEPAFAPCPGGAVHNTAVALGRLEARAGLLTGLSSDLFGDMLRRGLEGAGVDHGLAVTADRPTTLAFVTLEEGQARYAFFDENTAGRMITTADLPAVPADVEALFFGGISLATEPCGSAFETLMLREAGARPVMLDPNIRPGFIADEPAYRARLERMIAAADIVKLSDDDLGWLIGGEDLQAQAQAVRAMGAGLVIVTRGAAGATAYGPGAPISVPARAVRVVDTVGAGDTFNAGLLAGLLAAGALDRAALAAPDPEALHAALDLATRAAAMTVARAGANPPHRAELS